MTHRRAIRMASVGGALALVAARSSKEGASCARAISIARRKSASA